jgi:hypothetical protein
LEEIEAARNGKAHERVRVPEQIPKGVQHTTLFRLGCAMRAKGLEEAEIFAALWEVNQRRCQEPGPEKDIRKLAESICKYPAGTSQGPQEDEQPTDDQVPPEYRYEPGQSNGRAPEAGPPATGTEAPPERRKKK